MDNSNSCLHGHVHIYLGELDAPRSSVVKREMHLHQGKLILLYESTYLDLHIVFNGLSAHMVINYDANTENI